MFVLIQRNDYINKIRPFIGKPVIKIITGLRRVGKSTILKQLTELIHREYPAGKILYINMESWENSHIRTANDLFAYVRNFRGKAPNPSIFLFIDEVQQIEDWEKAVNSFFSDNWADIFITGSNSSILSSDLSTRLSGRFIEFSVYTLSYEEFLTFTGKAASEDVFYQFLEFGGLPGIHYFPLEREIVFQYIRSVYDTIILRDVVERNRIRDVALLEKIVHYLMDITGNIFSGKNVSRFFKNEFRSVSLETIYNYLRYLESAFFIANVPRFDIHGKKKLEVAGKYYFLDTGLKNSISGFKTDLLPGLLENCVLLELKRRGYTVFVGKLADTEIDFIAENQNIRIYIQVAYVIPDNGVFQREFSPLTKIPDNYGKYVVTMDRLPPSEYNGINRLYLPDFLLQKEW